jgi:signal transduction histidine kinase
MIDSPGCRVHHEGHEIVDTYKDSRPVQHESRRNERTLPLCGALTQLMERWKEHPDFVFGIVAERWRKVLPPEIVRSVVPLRVEQDGTLVVSVASGPMRTELHYRKELKLQILDICREAAGYHFKELVVEGSGRHPGFRTHRERTR